MTLDQSSLSELLDALKAGGEMAPDSDVDLLVEFEPGRVPGLIRLAGTERELSPLFGGREIELRTYGDLSRYFRGDVRAEAVTLYGEGRPSPHPTET